MTESVRDADTGQFVSSHCTDPNCDGDLIADTKPGYVGAGGQWVNVPIWRCDGLTHDTTDGPLRACTREVGRAYFYKKTVVVGGV